MTSLAIIIIIILHACIVLLVSIKFDNLNRNACVALVKPLLSGQCGTQGCQLYLLLTACITYVSTRVKFALLVCEFFN